MHLHEAPYRPTLAHRPYNFFSIRSFIAALSSANSAYVRLSRAFSASNSFTRRSSDASSPPCWLYHL